MKTKAGLRIGDGGGSFYNPTIFKYQQLCEGRDGQST
jgi:hypothetical protein